ncbi:MAG: FG-GAP-like repeat-containing protein [bacterium]|nr:FG-GAP-like repeat-containing protein [bacterium]
MLFGLLALTLFSRSNAWPPGFLPLFGSEDEENKIQTMLDEGRELRSRCLFDRAIFSFNRALEIDPLHEEATYEIGETYMQAHRWADAMDWFYAVSIIDRQRRDVFVKRWEALTRFAQDDPMLREAAHRAIKREIADFMNNHPWDWQTMSAARQGALLIGDSFIAAEMTSSILEFYPETSAAYSILSDQFYEGLYPIWDDNSAKISYIRGFLSRCPPSDFRETAWKYLVSALNETDRVNELRHALDDWIAEDADTPIPYERGIRYLLDRDESPTTLLPLGRIGVEKCRGWLGKPLKPVEQRIIEAKYLYAGTRLNMGRIKIGLGRFSETRLWLTDGIRHSDFDADDDGTNAGFELYYGIIEEQESNYDAALQHYINALVQGDMSGTWTTKADSLAQNLFETHFSSSASNLLELARQKSGYNGPIFDDVTSEYGLSGVKAGRIAWGDANGDGFDDLLVGGYRLFLNQKGARFTEITETAGLHGEGITGGVWADVDLDGDLDLFCASNGAEEQRDRLYLNKGNDPEGIPQFHDVTDLCSVIADSFPTEGAAWGDLQGDGRPDLYVANYEKSGPEIARGTPDYLYVNRPDPLSPIGFRFDRWDAQSGLKPPFGENLCGRGVNWGDFDDDGDQDIYVSYYRLQRNLLWENNRGMSLNERACFYGLGGRDKEGWWGNTIGSEWGDFDNDGDLDLITANLAHPRYIQYSDRTCLYENRLRQDGIFREVRAEWGIKYEETHSDPAWGDVDSDGDLDLYITSIYPNRRSFLYLNDLKHLRFGDVTYLAGVRVNNGWGCAFSDFDRDGDLDLVVGCSDGIHLFRNRGRGYHWLEVEIKTPGSGYGTQVTLKRGKTMQYRQLQGGKGTTSQHSSTIYFGLGDKADPVNLEIRFPSGKKLKLKKIFPDQRLEIVEPRGK